MFEGLTAQQLDRLKNRFEEKVDILAEDQCWKWRASVSDIGYGYFSVGSKMVRSHRVSYELYKGKIGDLFVCHTCDVRECVNPNHLYLGTQLSNMRDRLERGKYHDQRNDKNYNAKLNFEDAKEIRRLYKAAKLPQRELAEMFSVSRSTISNVINERVWLSNSLPRD